MSSEFLYSEQISDAEGNVSYTNEVDASALNDIAIDLGIAEYNNFADGEEYAVNKINEITRDLTSKGILQIGNKCAVSINTDENKIYIADGVCVFSDGSKWRSNTGVTIESYDTAATNYVYLLRDTVNNKISLCCTTNEPTSGEFVMLAEISSAGTVADRREWSLSKTTKGICLLRYFECPSEQSYEWHSIDIGDSDYTIVIVDTDWKYVKPPVFVDLSDGEIHQIEVSSGNYRHRIDLKKEGTFLNYYFDWSGNANGFYVL